MLFLKALGDNLFQSIFLVFTVISSPQSSLPYMHIFIMLISVIYGVSVSVTPFFHKDKSHIGLRTYPISCDLILTHILITSAKTLFPNKITFTGVWYRKFYTTLLCVWQGRITQLTHKNCLTQLVLAKLNILCSTPATNLTLYMKYIPVKKK